MSPATVQLFYALLTVLAFAVVAIVVVVRLFALGSTSARGWYRAIGTVLEPNALGMAFVVASLATVGSLYFSEVAHFEPCRLCWYQRIVMYPLVVDPGDRRGPARPRRRDLRPRAGGHRRAHLRLPRRARMDPGARHRRLRDRAGVHRRLVPRARVRQPADDGARGVPLDRHTAVRARRRRHPGSDKRVTSKQRPSRRAARQGGPPPPSPPVRWVLPVAGFVIAAAAVIAIVLSQSGSGPAASVAPTVAVVAPPTITGAPLPDFTATKGDPAIGQAAPVVEGHDYQGNAVGIAPNGTPTLVIFAAHWCPHCQREIPLIQEWLTAKGAPTGVDLVSVSTGVDPSLPNYPPEAWFERVGWTVPVIVDPTNSVAAAYGLTSYPFFVLLDGEGKVISRASGELSIADLEALLATATGS